jgi:hypothetical protein
MYTPFEKFREKEKDKKFDLVRRDNGRIEKLWTSILSQS